MSQVGVLDGFARALNQRLDQIEGCPEDWGRAKWLSRSLHRLGLTISQQGTRKWLCGESLPSQQNAVLLGRLLRVDASALLDGRIVPTLGKPGDELAAALGDIWPLMPPAARAELIEFAAFKAGLAPNKQDVKPTPSESPGGDPIPSKK